MSFTTDVPAARPGPLRRTTLGFFAILVIAVIVRVAAAWDDLWMDEIWALGLAQLVNSPLDVFTKLHHETNHYLNTIWLHSIGSTRGNWWGYRIPAIAFGIGSVVLAWKIGRRRSETEGLFAAMLIAISYPFVLYSSEARGYSGSVFFAFAAFYLLQSYFQQPRVVIGLAFAACEIGGLVSHLAFVGMLASTAAWSVMHWVRSRWERGQVAGLIAIHLVPWLLFVLLYLADIRLLTVGGGTDASSMIGIFGSAFAWAVGTTGASRVTLLACLVAIIFLNAGFRFLWHEKASEGVFFAGAIIIFPVALILARSSNVLYPRYFLLGMAFFLLLMARLAADGWRRDARRRRVIGLFLALFVGINLWDVGLLLTFGRGSGEKFVRYLCEAKTSRDKVTLAADNELRVEMLLNFYGRGMPGVDRLAYFRPGTWPPGGVEFFIRTQEAFELPDKAEIERYELIRTFRAAPLAGLHYFVYRRKE